MLLSQQLTPFMMWLNFAKNLLGVTFMSLFKNLLCELFGGRLDGLAPEREAWGPLAQHFNEAKR